jgi:hypothetical protein
MTRLLDALHLAFCAVVAGVAIWAIVKPIIGG